MALKLFVQAYAQLLWQFGLRKHWSLTSKNVAFAVVGVSQLSAGF